MTLEYRVPLRVVFYKEDGDWVAHCLEFDLCGDGPSKAEALQALSESVRLQIAKSSEFDNWDNLFTAADPEICERFFAGQNIAEADLEFCPPTAGPVVLLSVEYREHPEDLVGGVLPGHDFAEAG